MESETDERKKSWSGSSRWGRCSLFGRFLSIYGETGASDKSLTFIIYRNSRMSQGRPNLGGQSSGEERWTITTTSAPDNQAQPPNGATIYIGVEIKIESLGSVSQGQIWPYILTVGASNHVNRWLKDSVFETDARVDDASKFPILYDGNAFEQGLHFKDEDAANAENVAKHFTAFLRRQWCQRLCRQRD